MKYARVFLLVFVITACFGATTPATATPVGGCLIRNLTSQSFVFDSGNRRGQHVGGHVTRMVASGKYVWWSANRQGSGGGICTPGNRILIERTRHGFAVSAQ